MNFVKQIPFERLRGLKPQAWLCIGPGFVREDVKAHLLRRQIGFVAETITSVQEVCLRILNGVDDGEDNKVLPQKILGSHSRQEVLRLLLAEPRISSDMPELKRLRRQSGFFKKLDRAIQGGRLASAHGDEENVYLARLEERLGPNPVREECRRLAAAYSGWLRASGLWDGPALLCAAAQLLHEGACSRESASFPDEIFYFSAQTPESLERDFWDALGRIVTVTQIGPTFQTAVAEVAENDLVSEVTWERWHTLDDAADSLAERLVGRQDWNHQAVLIPDLPAIRRSLRRAFENYGVPLADPRDPTRIRWEEQVKQALLPLELVARGFERQKVIAWIMAECGDVGLKQMNAWVLEINQRGIRQGLQAYAGGKLTELHAQLAELDRTLGGRKRCAELGEAHLNWLRARCAARGTEVVNPTDFPLVAFFERFWTEFSEDIARVELGFRRAPALFWLERVRERIDEASPPVERFKPESGVQLYRLSQAPLLDESVELWVFGLPASWISGDGVGDYWYAARDREVLAAEFSVRSGIQVRQERVALFRSWLTASQKTIFLDAQYDWDGRERVTLAPLFRDLAAGSEGQDHLHCLDELKCEERSAHARWMPSYGVLRTCPPQRLTLGAAPLRSGSETPLLNATEIDAYSRCPFQALGAHRWRLYDLREPEPELWGDVRGNILHSAVRLLLESRDAEGNFSRTPAEALAEAWTLASGGGATGGARGLLHAQRLQRHAQDKLLRILEVFCEKEREYVKRARTTIHSLEGPELKVDYPKFSIRGIPDRIDRHSDGSFILDYKSSSSLAKGKEMVEQGYRLQLPFYAIAARKNPECLGETIGVQFVELNRKGGRGNGIFFKQWNGKEEGKLTQSRAKSCIIEAEPAETWALCEAHLLSQAEAYVEGRFEAAPRKNEECTACRYADLCGKRRVGSEEDSEGGGE